MDDCNRGTATTEQITDGAQKANTLQLGLKNYGIISHEKSDPRRM